MLQPGWQNLISEGIWKFFVSKHVQLFLRFRKKMRDSDGGNHANPVTRYVPALPAIP